METRKYQSGGIAIRWKPQACIYAGNSVGTLPQVYDPNARPWLRPENATTPELINQVARCPLRRFDHSY